MVQMAQIFFLNTASVGFFARTSMKLSRFGCLSRWESENRQDGTANNPKPDLLLPGLGKWSWNKNRSS